MYKGICKSFENFWMGVRVLWVLGVDKKSTFAVKKWGTPNRRVKKLGLTSNPHKFFASAGAVRAPADAKNFWGWGLSPIF